MISFTVYGHPVAKGRARVVRTKSGKSVTYTPDKTASWEESVRVQALAHRPEKPLEGPIMLDVTFHMTKPKSTKRKYPHVKPDLDNLIKAIKDALNGLIWKDDGQIVGILAAKIYGDVPMVEVIVCRK